jgi:hypothetical protein
MKIFNFFAENQAEYELFMNIAKIDDLRKSNKNQNYVFVFK